MLYLICLLVCTQSLDQCMGNIRHSKFTEFKCIYCCYPPLYRWRKKHSQKSNTATSCRDTLIGSKGIKPLWRGYHLCSRGFASYHTTPRRRLSIRPVFMRDTAKVCCWGLKEGSVIVLECHRQLGSGYSKQFLKGLFRAVDCVNNCGHWRGL